MIHYISIKQILDDLLDHPMLQGLSFERAVNYAVRFILIIGAPTEFELKVAVVDIDNYRGILPCDFYEMVQVRLNGSLRVFRYTTDSFHLSECKGETDLTYKLLNNIIFTSVKDGYVEIVYNSIKVDSEGYPMIPDNSSFILALELYIKKLVFTILFDLGKINLNVLQNTLLEYAWYVGQALRELNMPSIDQMESICNIWSLLLLRTTEHSRGMRTLGRKEYIKVK